MLVIVFLVLVKLLQTFYQLSNYCYLQWWSGIFRWWGSREFRQRKQAVKDGERVRSLDTAEEVMGKAERDTGRAGRKKTERLDLFRWYSAENQ